LAQAGVIDIQHLSFDSLPQNPKKKDLRNVGNLPNVHPNSKTMDGGKIFCMVETEVSTSVIEWERLAKIWTGFAVMRLIYTWLKIYSDRLLHLQNDRQRNLPAFL
jgi:hypothetical protein